MFCGVIGIYSASSVITALFSAVKSLATVRRSSLTLEGFSTVPPDFTEVLIVVSSALSSKIFFFRSSGSICFISRLRSIANGLLLLGFYLRGFHDRRLDRSGRRDTGRRSLHRGLVYEIHSGRQDSDFDAKQALYQLNICYRDFHTFQNWVSDSREIPGPEFFESWSLGCSLSVIYDLGVHGY